MDEIGCALVRTWDRRWARVALFAYWGRAEPGANAGTRGARRVLVRPKKYRWIREDTGERLGVAWDTRWEAVAYGRKKFKALELGAPLTDVELDKLAMLKRQAGRNRKFWKERKMRENVKEMKDP